MKDQSLLAECYNKGHKIDIHLIHGYVSIFTDNVLTQRDLSLTQFIRWAGNALEDGTGLINL